MPFVELLRERIFKFGRNSNNLVWRQEKLLAFFKLFEQSLDIYLENQNFARGNAELFENLPDKKETKKDKDNKAKKR